MSTDELILKGARQNNLKDLSLALPHNRVIAVTGVSGSGKSSLAFDTIFAEGQWRFIESLSTYARLFLEKLDRPQVEAIENIRPAIALEQRNPVRGSRSTVGTLTEMYDYFRLLYAKVGTAYCPRCGEEIHRWHPSDVTRELMENYRNRKAVVTFESPEKREDLGKRGFLRLWREGRVLDFEDAPEAGPPFEVVLDRLVLRDEKRLADSVETAFREGDGRMKVRVVDGPERSFVAGNVCDGCGYALEEPSPLLFSFNHPVGACPQCKGFGNILRYDESLIVPDPYLSLAEGAVEPWEKPAARWWKSQLLKGAPGAGIDVNKPYRKLSRADRTKLFKGTGAFEGIDEFFEELEGKRYKLHVRVFLSRYRKGVLCPACRGKRLRPEALAYRIGDLDIAELCGLPVSGLMGFFGEMPLSPFQKMVAAELLRQIELKLGFLHRVGLDYLTLWREGKTLSGGEYQRVNLSNQLSSRLTGTLYVLDEPTVGLHKRDTDRVSEIMAELADIGNTVIVVEHDKGVIEGADWVVELGPGGGHLGGNVVFAGEKRDFLQADTVTSRYVRGLEEAAPPVERPRTGSGWLRLEGASGNNLRDVDLEVPLGTLAVISGVSGSGKSTLAVDTLYKALVKNLRLGTDSPLPYRYLKGFEALKSVKLVDQSPIGRSPRSNPVTYMKIFDHIRKLFAEQPEARARGYGPGFFSFNVPGGRCETCKGEGYQKLEMYFFEDLYITCEDCGGRRYGREALGVTYQGKSIDEVLKMTVDEAALFFGGQSQIQGRLALLREVGLGYLILGQPAPTLSGGEAQRLKICAELGVGRVRGVLYVLDEPTVGLHMKDVGALLTVLGKLVDSGNTVLVIEHNLDVIRAADWLVDLGPEGGEQGGEVLFAGPPEKIVEATRSYTGRYVGELLAARAERGEAA
ncbi:MAG: excinuclease ABC subunit UvrA [Nitrospirota bacterium]